MSISTVKLNRNDGTPWGFRLQGGKDFATPLCVQKVNGGSLAAVAGLQAGDAIVSIGGRDALLLRHKEAQEAIVRAGHNFDLVIQRGTQVWRPQVTPLAQVKTTPEGVSVATSTSLAANKKFVAPAGTKHNTLARPFAEVKVNGQQIVNAQYNTPLQLYSEDNIAETLSAQAEVLGKGCLGVNFMKNERPYDPSKTSDVLRMVQEMDSPPVKEPQESPVESAVYAPTHAPTHAPAQAPVPSAGHRSVRAPETRVRAPGEPSPLQATKCSECERPITGVFVRVKNKSLHADCFKCATCGSSLKNVGYYNINEKLYCDVHAKQAARNNPPAPNMDPIIVKPGATAPSGALPMCLAKAAAPYKPPVGGIRIMPSMPASTMPVPAPMPKFIPIAMPKPEPEVAAPEAPPAPEPQPLLPPQPVAVPLEAPEPEPVPAHPEPIMAPPPAPLLVASPPPVMASPPPVMASPPPVMTPPPPPAPMAPAPVPELQAAPAPVEVAPAPIQAHQEPIFQPEPEPEPEPAPEPAPIPAPAFAPIQVPAAPMAAPPPIFNPIKAPAAPAPQRAPFGAAAGGVDVRSHLPKKGPAPVLPKPSALPNLGGGPMKGVAQTSGQKVAPRRGRGVMNPSTSARIPMCAEPDCGRQIRGPFVSALGKTWCPDHFVCSTASCRKALIDMGFVEEQGALHCEDCYERFLAPICGKCDKRVKGDCLNAVGKQFHPECFCCAYCGKIFGSGAFYLEDGLPYCEGDWNDLFTTKCVGCGFPIEAGDRWVEALNNNYHSQCFKCSKCNKNLEGQSFFAKGGKPFCKAHAQRGL